MRSTFFLSAAFAALCATSVRGRLVNYEWDLTWESGSPNGQARDMIFTDGQFPGPPIIVDEGDDVVVAVTNKMSFNSTIHWHGMEQYGTPWADGVPGLSQKPIEPGQTYTYRFKASPAGTYWYHSHERMTLEDGLYGALHVRPKPGTPTPFSMISNDSQALAAMAAAEANPQIVLLSEWDHYTSQEYLEAEKTSQIDLFCVDSVLINGMGSVLCPGQDFLNSVVGETLNFVLNGSNVTDKGCLPNVANTQGNWTSVEDPSLVPVDLNSGCVASNGSTPKFSVDAKHQWASFNFISGCGLKALIFSIDEHPMWIYAVDGHYIEPQLAHSAVIYNGERYSVMVQLNNTPGDYIMRVAGSGGDQIVQANAVVSYAGGSGPVAPQPYITYGGLNTSASVIPLDLDTLVPYPSVLPSTTADAQHMLGFRRLGSAWQWTLNNVSLYADDRDAYNPLLFSPNQTDGWNQDLVIRTQNGSWVDIILQVIDDAGTPVNPPHAIHKHSNKAFIIGSAFGIFNWSSVAEAQAAVPSNFNLQTPRYRDTFITSPVAQGWTVIRYQVVNPGAFLLHCHIETHLAAGMAIAMLDGVDEWPETPMQYQLGL